MIGIILAAGAGRKFWPYADVRNKCAFPVANVPVVRRLAEQLLAAGVDGLVVVVGAHGRSVRAALAGLESRLVFVEQPRPEGTADALLHALEGTPAEPVLVTYGDTLTTPETVARVVAAAERAEAPAAALVVPLDGDRPQDCVGAQVQDGVLTEWEGHGRDATHRLGGLFVLGPETLPYLRANPGLMTHVPVGGMPPLEADLAESLARMTADGLDVAAILPEGFALDLDRPWQILQANRALLADASRRLESSQIAAGASVDDSAEIYGRVVLAPGARIGKRVVVHGDLWLESGAEVTNGSIVGSAGGLGCHIGARTRVRDYALLGEATTLGPQAIVGHGAEFEGVLLEGAYLYHYCEILGVVGARVDIGAATVCGTLRFDDAEATHRVAGCLGRRELPRHGANASYLGDYSRTGVNAVLMPGVKVGAYSCVGPGVILGEDLLSRELVTVKQELQRKPWGPERYGW